MNNKNFVVERLLMWNPENGIRERGNLLISPFTHQQFFRVSPNILPKNDGNNINGPSLIKVPDWVENPLGEYYLYFAHHSGKYIRMAYSMNKKKNSLLDVDFKVHEPGTLKLGETPGYDHIASPDVHIDNENKEIVMYYHTPYKDWQYTFKATSKDGINFVSDDKPLGMFYFRVFKWKDRTFSIAKNKNTSGIAYELINGEWVTQEENFIENMRHAAVLVQDDKVFVFYTIVGETPESIYCSEVDINNGWKLENTEMLLKPSYPYEGSNYPLAPSKFGSAVGVNELRDPCVFDDDGEIYLLYTVMGEVSITMTKLHRINSETKKYHIWGMRRSGNHAITEWISSHFNSTFHRNDIIKDTPWNVKKYESSIKQKVNDCIINSYEDFEPIEVNDGTIIILRDWYNMCASRLNSGRDWQNSCRYKNELHFNRNCAEVYLEYCKLWEKYPDNFILYNKWCNDKNYEKEIEERYGLKRVVRKNILPESGIGEGSSFEEKLSEDSKFNERYLKVIKKYPEDWKLIISNEEINKYCKKIFGIDIKEL